MQGFHQPLLRFQPIIADDESRDPQYLYSISNAVSCWGLLKEEHSICQEDCMPHTGRPAEADGTEHLFT